MYIVSFYLKKNKLYFTNIDVERIGHLIVETIEINIKHSDKKFILPYTKGANLFYIKNLKLNNVLYVKSRFIKLLSRMHQELGRNFICINYVQRFSIGGLEIYKSLSRHKLILKSILNLSTSEALNTLNTRYGISSTVGVVAVHCRITEEGRADNRIQAYRNANFENLIPSIQHLISIGYVVIRIGSPDNMNLVHDFEKNYYDLRIDCKNMPELTFIIAQAADFLIGNTSGISLLYKLLDKQVVFCNMAPFHNKFGIEACDISISKHYRLTGSKEFMPEEQIESYGIANCRDDRVYKKLNIEVVENTEDEILNSVIVLRKSITSPVRVLSTKSIKSRFSNQLLSVYSSLSQSIHLN